MSVEGSAAGLITERMAITGADGFIGRHLCRALAPVRPVVRLVRSPSDTQGVQVAVDLADGLATSKVLEDVAPDVVVHCAWAGHPRTAGVDYTRQVSENIVASANLAAACGQSGVRHVVLLSSGGAINRSAHRSRRPPAYGWAKRVTEAIFEASAHDFGFHLTTLRPTAVYGAGQDPSRGLGVLTVFVASMLRSEPIHLFGGGDAARDFLHVDDLSSCVGEVVAREAFGTFEVGGPELLRLDEIVRLLEATLERTAQVVVDVATGLDQERVALDDRPITAATGWRPKIRVADALGALAIDVAARLGLVDELPASLQRARVGG